jgi:enoyl-CoA hydratase
MSEILLEMKEHVAVITLNAPERRNAMNPDMTKLLVNFIEEVDANREIGAAVIQGAGESFCAGADRRVLSNRGANPNAMAPDDPGDGYRAFMRVGEMKVPTVAAIRGYAVGAGVNLAFATDLRIVAEDARLRSGFLRIGIHPGGGHFVLLGRTAGREAVSAMGLFGQDLTGRRAAELGAAWEALPADQVEPRALELATYAGADPELARANVRSMHLELGPPSASWPAAMEMERAIQSWSLFRREQRASTAT